MALRIKKRREGQGVEKESTPSFSPSNFILHPFSLLYLYKTQPYGICSVVCLDWHAQHIHKFIAFVQFTFFYQEITGFINHRIGVDAHHA